MKRTSRQPAIIAGIVWRSYRVGVNRYATLSDTEPRARIERNYNKTTYSAWVDGRRIGDRYRSETNAATSAIAHMQARGFTLKSYEQDERK